MNSIRLNKKCKDKYHEKLNNINWVLKKYLLNNSEKNGIIFKSIDYLLNIKNKFNRIEKEISTPEVIESFRRNMIQRTLALSFCTQKKIWKPDHYIPSKVVVLANTMEQLNNLYKIN